MALIKCPECGKDFSDTAKACPNCGYIKGKQPIHKKNVLISVLIILSIVIGISTYFFLGQRGTQKPENMSEAAYRSGINALEIIDSYLNQELSEKEAYNKLDRIYSLFIASDNDDMWRDDGVKIDIMAASFDIMKMATPPALFEASGDKLKKIYEIRDELAESLNLKKKYNEYYQDN